MTHFIRKGAAPLVAALALAGCAAPAFKQPDIAVPAVFKEDQAPVTTAADGTRWTQARPADTAPRGTWWLAFHDPALDQLIGEATNANASLAVAVARVRQARAIAGIAEADRMPQVGLDAGVRRQRQAPLELGLPDGTRVPPQTGYSVKLAASYEVDLFGRVAASAGAARADAAQADANRAAVLLSLQADVAQAYFRLRATDAELLTLAETVRLREENVRVNERRFALGDIGEFDLARARTELSTARAEAIGLQRQRAALEHGLALLLGRPAANFTAAQAPLPDTLALPSIPAGLPSSLLQRRPDIVAAQRAMEAANARIGVARAAMFPALSLGAGAGGAAGTFADVFTWTNRSWMLGSLLSAPLVDGGRNRANVVRSEAALEEAVAAYRQGVLTAFADVEDNLAALRVLSGQAAALDDALVSARRAAALAQHLYDAGRTGYLDLIEAQRNLTGVERAAVQLRGYRAVATVALIRSLGGGWGS
jgi:outer membrane protein, multidrug efflux system